MITAALDQLIALENPAKAIEAEAYHKTQRRYLGISVPQLEPLIAAWRAECDLPARIDLAAALWDSNIHDARICAAKLLIQARIKGDEPVWDLIKSWVPQFDAWAIADTVCSAGGKRLMADPTRLDHVETWLTHDVMWVRRAAMVMTLPWAKIPNPKSEDEAVRDRIGGWMVQLSPDRDWFIQKSIGWWLRDLSKHDAARTADWLAAHGMGLKRFARIEAATYLTGDLRERALPQPDAPVAEVEASGGDV